MALENYGEMRDAVREPRFQRQKALALACLLYTSDAADERSSVDLGGRRIIKKKNIVKRGCYTAARVKQNTMNKTVLYEQNTMRRAQELISEE